ncbi:MAG: sugar transferase [Candidatus Vogelbacteria bacterium]|nr:sugar transferase [Candidatus Vogelbacteria bacterium]
MRLTTTREQILLIIGDLAAFVLALWLTLLVRYQAAPETKLFSEHVQAFWVLFLTWLAVFYISDLYQKHTTLFRQELTQIIFKAELANSVIALAFFYFIPLSITPKINLFIYLALSFILVWLWRAYGVKLFYLGKTETIIFLCEGPDVEAIKQELSHNSQYRLRVANADPVALLARGEVPVVVYGIARNSPTGAGEVLPELLAAGVRFINVYDLYEDLFRRIPTSLLTEHWFLENISTQPHSIYDLLKRFIDIVIGSIIGLLSLLIYPFIYLALKLEGKGSLFFFDERVGRFGRVIKVRKFRTMTTEANLSERKVTAVGRFLRQTRLDELPQIWGVLRGDQSLIGPRPEKPDYVKSYNQQIPFYTIRHVIAPGLSGWAQIYQENHPHFAPAIEATQEKLSYDLYYIKHRSIWLDLAIALKTLRIVLTGKGK